MDNQEQIVDTEVMKIEAILFASSDPMPLEQIAKGLGCSKSQAYTKLKKLQDEYFHTERGICILQNEEGYYMASKPEYHDMIKKVLVVQKKGKLTPQAMEVLLIIALYEPATKDMVQQIRGIDSNDTVEKLMKLGFVERCGTLPGSAHQGVYRTTKKFLDVFHLESLDDLKKKFEETQSEQIEQDFLL